MTSQSSRSDIYEANTAKPDGYYDVDRAEVLPYIPDGDVSILDVGCGSGNFGKALKDRNPACIVWGVESNQSAATAAAAKLDKVIAAEFADAREDLKVMQFDVISFNDVLEHMVRPEQALLQCHELLSPDGVVVASIPNILFYYQIKEILVEQDWKYTEFGILDDTHLRFFTRKSIIRMFRTCGYDVTMIEGINPAAGRKYKLLNLLTLGHMRDWKYLQFVVQASPVRP